MSKPENWPMSARAIAIHGNEMSGERRANLEIKSEGPALIIGDMLTNLVKFFPLVSPVSNDILLFVNLSPRFVNISTIRYYRKLKKHNTNFETYLQDSKNL